MADEQNAVVAVLDQRDEAEGAIKGLNRSGSVPVAPVERMPPHTGLAAIYRS